jgi:hypothetical protein
MTPSGEPSAPIALGDTLPELVVQTAEGDAFPLASLRGRPWGVVCIRYYG